VPYPKNKVYYDIVRKNKSVISVKTFTDLSIDEDGYSGNLEKIKVKVILYKAA